MADAARFDRKMAADEGAGGKCVWYEPACGEIRVDGLAFFAQERAWNRLPASAGPMLRELRPAMLELARHTAGASLRFCTDSPQIWVRAEVEAPAYMSHMTPAAQCGCDCYVRAEGGAWIFAGLTKFLPANSRFCCRLAQNLPGPMEVCVNLPLYIGVKSVEIGLATGARLWMPPAHRRRAAAFYGTSITQGGCASRPGMAYPAILSRMLEAPTYNFGFSGNGVGLPELAAVLCAVPGLGALVVDIEPNAGPEHVLEKNLPRFLSAVRACAPALPVLVLSGTPQPAVRWDGELAQACEQWAAFAREEVRRRKASGDAQIAFADARALVGAAGGEATVDGVHLTDLGFYALAQGLAPLLETMLG